MAMHIAESANIHQYVEAQRSSGVEGAQGLIVTAAIPQANLDNLRNTCSCQARNQIANLTVRMMARRVEQRCSQLNLKRLTPLNQVNNFS
jgi:hypothetical protein